MTSAFFNSLTTSQSKTNRYGNVARARSCRVFRWLLNFSCLCWFEQNLVLLVVKNVIPVLDQVPASWFHTGLEVGSVPECELQRTENNNRPARTQTHSKIRHFWIRINKKKKKNQNGVRSECMRMFGIAVERSMTIGLE